MRVIIEENPQAASKRAAEFMAQQVKTKPESVLGLATGSTPLQIYADLIQRHEAGQLDFSKVTTFNLDEYVGLVAIICRIKLIFDNTPFIVFYVFLHIVMIHSLIVIYD